MFQYSISLSEIHVDLPKFKQKALHWAQQFPVCAYYEHNQIPYPYHGFQNFLAVTSLPNSIVSSENSFESLRSAILEKTWLCGLLGYDLKNQVEKLISENPDQVNFPVIHFFKPEILIFFKADLVFIESVTDYGSDVFKQIIQTELPTQPAIPEKPVIQNRVAKEDYIANVEKIRQHILEGDVYELNYCQEFYAQTKNLLPNVLFWKLNTASPMPFAGFFKLHDKYLLCASPERFLKKEGTKLISQPIKGTIKRGITEQEDLQQKNLLQNDEKEKAENMMIVDLVRNDLGRTAKTGTVKVEEIFGIYGFQHVFQMISTITSEPKPEFSAADVLKTTFPMGSMTGAPKIKAMELIEQYEQTKRGLYSGSIGYITPSGNFDFNVVIRSIQYNSATGYLNFMVGSAITYDSVPEKEYDECLLKAKAIMQVLS